MEMISTNAVKPSDRFAFWRDQISRTFVDGRLERHGDGPFEGHIKSRRCGSVLVSHIASEAQIVLRGTGEIARSPRPYYLFLVQTSGMGLVAQNAREAVLHPGDIALIDTLRPYRFHFTEAFRQLCVMVPHQSLLAVTRQDLSALVARRIRHETMLGKLCRTYIATLCEADDTMPAEESGAIATNMLDLLGHVVGAQGSPHAPGQLARAQAFICRNFADDRLSPAFAAAELGFSLRKLYQLFHDSGVTFKRYLTDVRLLNAAEKLSRDPESSVRISDIAYSAGFRDLSHFCRAFKARFGQTPRTYRAARGR